MCWLAEAIENTEVPDQVFCLEGHPNHLARTDSPCESHAATTNGIRQVIVNLFKLQVEVRKASNKAVKDKENLPVIKITGIVNARLFLSVTLYSDMELSTPCQRWKKLCNLSTYNRLSMKQEIILLENAFF
jgi:hypothetical protein